MSLGAFDICTEYPLSALAAIKEHEAHNPVVTWSAFEEHSWDTWVCCPYANQVDYVANLSIMI